MMVKILIGNARSLGADTKIEVTATVALMEEDDVLVFWETGMRDTNVLEMPGYRRIAHASKPGISPPTFVVSKLNRMGEFCSKNEMCTKNPYCTTKGTIHRHVVRLLFHFVSTLYTRCFMIDSSALTIVRV